MLKKIFKNRLDNIISLKLGLDIYEYLDQKNRVNWRDFEDELHFDYPIKGTSIKFNSKTFENWKGINDNKLIINNKKDLGPHEITDELASEPFKYREMTFTYLFSILEDFGNQIVEIRNKDYFIKKGFKKGRSWHSGITKTAKEKNINLAPKFAESFGINPSDLNQNIVNQFYELKQKRNLIIHELYYPNIQNFKEDINSIFLIICYLYFVNDDSQSEFEYYPYFDYDKNQ